MYICILPANPDLVIGLYFWSETMRSWLHCGPNHSSAGWFQVSLRKAYLKLSDFSHKRDSHVFDFDLKFRLNSVKSIFNYTYIKYKNQ